MPFYICILILLYGFINAFSVIAYSVIIDSKLEYVNYPVEYSLPILYKGIWNDLRYDLNATGSIIVEIIIHMFTLPALILINLITYLILVPGKYIIKLFYYLFRNKENTDIGC